MKFYTSLRDSVCRVHSVYVARNSTGRTGIMKIISIGIIGMVVCISFIGTCPAASEKDLKTAITALSNKLAQAEATAATLKNDLATLMAKIDLTNVNKSILLVAGIVPGTSGGSVQVPITLIPGAWQAAGFQATITLPTGFTLKSVVAGPAALTASKTLGVNLSNGIFLVYGINQNIIGTGVVAIATINLPAGLRNGIYPVLLTGPVATDANGNTNIDMCTTSGEIKL